VALDKCFELKPGQRVIIEKYGDVTVTGESQIEVKEYNDQLTDRHENFWKTLNNWMHPSFNDADYTSLILLTTQSYGSKTRLSMWNEGDTSRRLDILDTIYSESVLRESQRIAKGGAPKAISDSFKFQRLVMDTSRREKLDRICSKVIIASN